MNTTKIIDKSSLVASFTFENSSYSDRSGLYTGTSVGTTTFSKGNIGDCLVTQDRTYIDYSDVLNLTGDFTISCWAKTNNNQQDGYGGIVGKTNGNQGWGLWMNTNTNISFQVDSTFYSFGNVVVDRWYNIIFVRNSSTNINSLYEQGYFLGSFSATMSSTTAPFTIGMAQDPQYSLNGSISNINIFNRVLSRNEISYLYYSKK